MEPFELETDINSFFKEGFSVNLLRRELADSLLIEARKLTFIESDGKYQEDESLIAPQTANWQSPFLPKRFCEPTPDLFKVIGSEIAKSSGLKWFREQFGEFSQSSFMVNRYRPGSGMVFHNDNFDATFLSVLVYLTKDEFYPFTDGGELKVGKVTDFELVKDARVTDQHVLGTTHYLTPDHGKAVILNNLNPLHVHAVERLASNKERYTLLCHFGYFENTCRTYRKVVG